MAAGYITKRAVDALAPSSGIIFLWDAGDGSTKGFGVRVTPAGIKSFVYQFRVGGRAGESRRCTIGRYGEWTVDKARKRANELAEQVRRGIDPVDAQQDDVKARAVRKAASRDQERAARELAFSAYADRFLELHTKRATRNSYTFAEGLLRNHAKPVLADKPLPAITKRDIIRVIDSIPHERPAVRRNCFAVLRKLFNWAVSRDDLATSPMDKMTPPPSVQSRDRVLGDGELALAMKAAASLSYPFGPLYELLFITGQRREEAAGLDWSELDRTAALWMLPRARSKNGEGHDVPLSAAAIAALDRAAGRGLDPANQWPRKGLVFSTTGTSPVSGFSRAKVTLDTAMLAIARQETLEAGEEQPDALTPWRLHDARRTLATGLQRLGVRFEVTEAVLNHVSGSRSGVAGVYQRHGWGPEKRAALDAWAAHVDALLSPAPDTGNVVRLRSPQ
ncbi:MAG: integrase arm-type DNA-binding domain-containing protein [Pseudomonadota bacterium]